MDERTVNDIAANAMNRPSVYVPALVDEITRLRAELAERDENAERYLWLRANWDRVATRVECDNAATRVVHIELLDRRSYRPLDVGSLDAALDEARKGEETQ